MAVFAVMTRAGVTRLLLLLCIGVMCSGSPARAGDKEGVGAFKSAEDGSVAFVDGLLSVRVEAMPLSVLVREIARLSDIELTAYEPLHGVTSIELDRLPLQEALRRVLRRRNYILLVPKSSSSTGPSRLWILSEGDSDAPSRFREVGDAVASQAAFTELEAALRNADVWEREEAVDLLGESSDPRAIVPLRTALTDDNEGVRQIAISALARIGGVDAATALAIALSDEHTWLREEAVEALGRIGGPDSIRLLEQARRDEHLSVREGAAEMLARLRSDDE